MKQFFKIFLLGLLVVAVAACSRLPRKYQFIRNNSNDYRTATTLPPLSIPPGYSSNKFKAYYVVPNPQLAKQATAVDLLPPDLTTKDIPKLKHWWDF